MDNFHHVKLSLLARQLKLGPISLRRREIERTEELLATVDPAKEYPYAFVYHWITGTHTPPGRETARPHLLSGRHLLGDLASMILMLSDSLDVKLADMPQGTTPLEDVAENYSVSTKTIARWRKRGLTARKAIFPDGRRRLVFLPDSLQRFARRQQHLVREGAKFERVSEGRRSEIISQARALFRQGDLTPYQICVHLARQEGRAVETIRSLLRGNDRRHPEQAVFPPASAPLSREQKNDLFEAIERGASPTKLARRYQRSRSSIYRLVSEIRSERLLSQPIELIYSPQFDLPGFGSRIELLPKETAGEEQFDHVPGEQPLHEYLRRLGDEPLLAHSQEIRLFRRYNYLKFHGQLLREKLGQGPNSAELLNTIEVVLNQATVVKNRIIRANLHLVVGIARRHLGPQARLFELVSDGNIALLRAVEKFDYSRRYRFSTYATWVISREYARAIPAAGQRSQQYITGRDEMLDVAADGRGDGELLRPEVLAKRNLLNDILEVLEPRERYVVSAHFGLGRHEKPLSLGAIGESLGLTKERARQIEARAIRKLRQLLRPHEHRSENTL